MPQGSYGAGFGFTGEYTDANDLLYLRARYYAPEMGVFTALDPWEGKTCTPMSLNGYSWVEGNPVTNVDPSGHCVALVPVCAAAVGIPLDGIVADIAACGSLAICVGGIKRAIEMVNAFLNPAGSVAAGVMPGYSAQPLLRDAQDVIGGLDSSQSVTLPPTYIPEIPYVGRGSIPSIWDNPFDLCRLLNGGLCDGGISITTPVSLPSYFAATTGHRITWVENLAFDVPQTGDCPPCPPERFCNVNHPPAHMCPGAHMHVYKYNGFKKVIDGEEKCVCEVQPDTKADPMHNEVVCIRSNSNTYVGPSWNEGNPPLMPSEETSPELSICTGGYNVTGAN